MACRRGLDQRPGRREGDHGTALPNPPAHVPELHTRHFGLISWEKHETLAIRLGRSARARMSTFAGRHTESRHRPDECFYRHTDQGVRWEATVARSSSRSRNVTRSAKSGRFVSKAKAKSSPRTTVRERVGKGTSNKTTVHRSAATGRFVKASTAVRHPGTTITQRV